MLGHRQLSAAEFLEIWRRRRKWPLAALLLGSAAGFLIARLLPARFTSTAIIGDVRSRTSAAVLPAGAFSASQLSALRQHTLTPERLQGLVTRFGLESAGGSNDAHAQAVSRLEKAIVLSPSAAGFSLSYSASAAKAAQQGCDDLASLFLQEESKYLEREAALLPGGSAAATNPVAEYFAGQAADAKRNLDERQAALAEFRRQHSRELAGAGRGEAERRIADDEAQLQATDAALKRALQQRAVLTESLFARQSTGLQGRKPADTLASEALEQELAADQAQLVALESRYTPDHPDVLKLKTDISQLQKKIEEAKRVGATSGAKKSDPRSAADSSQTAEVQAQVRELDLLIQEKTREQGRLQLEILNARVSLRDGSIADQEYRELTAQAATARSLYTSLLAKQSEAQTAGQSVARQQQDILRLTVPPSLPELPDFPNPIFFTLGGAGAGLVAGLLVIAAGELGDRSLRTQGDVEHFLDLPTLALIPYAELTDSAGTNGEWGPRGGRTATSGEKEERVPADV